MKGLTQLKSKPFLLFLISTSLFVVGYVLASVNIISVTAHNPGNQTIGEPFNVYATTKWEFLIKGVHTVWVKVKHEVGGVSDWCNKPVEVGAGPTPGWRKIETGTSAQFNITSAGTYYHKATSYLYDEDDHSSDGPESNTSSSFQVSDP